MSFKLMAALTAFSQDHEIWIRKVGE